MQIPLITSLIHYFKVVYSYAGRKLYILLLLFLLSGLSESIGISMLLPILNIDKAAGSQDQFTKSIYNILESIGINVSLLSLIILLVIIFMFKGVSVFLQNYKFDRIKNKILCLNFLEDLGVLLRDFLHYFSLPTCLNSLMVFWGNQF